MVEQESVQRAIDLAKGGQRDEAVKMIARILKEDPDHVRAWATLARLIEAEDRAKAIFALKQVLRLRPGNAWARENLARLKGDEDDDLLPFWLAAAGAGAIMVALLFLVVFGGLLRRDGQPGSPAGQPDAALQQAVNLPMSDCRAIIEKALLVSDETCQRIGRNEVCYGNLTVSAELAPDVPRQFQLVGDVIPVEAVRALTASPLDVDAQEWGIAVFKLDAIMPGTMPGQTATFVVYGDTSLQNASGDMGAIYFSTGYGTITCDYVPFDGIMVRTPEGGTVSFRANGTDIVVSGTTVLDAQPGGEMTITALDGGTTVTADGKEQPVGPGQKVKVPLGGGDGLQAVGPPSEPQALPPTASTLQCMLTGNCPPAVAGREPADDPASPGSGQPTNTPVPLDPNQPTNTPVPVAPGQPTNTPVPLSTNTPAPGQPTNTPAPGQPTNTPVPTPTKTPVPTKTNTPVPTKTKTPVPTKTNTPVPTKTNTPVPTDTPAPTNTPETGTCSDISLSWSGDAELDISNDYGSDVVLTKVSITWPAGNGKLKKITLASPAIWTGGENPPSASITLGQSTDKRTIADGATKTLKFEFTGTPASSDYDVTVEFDVGCSRSKSN